MEHRALGFSGIAASVVGFGAWAIGGWTWGGADEAESIRAIHAFLDAGGNLIDTAPVYGFGRSEEVVGKATADRRDRVVLATKCVMRWDLSDAQKKRAVKKFTTSDADIDWGGNRTDKSFDVFIYGGRDGIFEEVERSLRRLRTDVIDLYQTHWQDDHTPIEERMGALMELKRQGKIRAIGVSNASPAQMDEYRRFGQVDSDQEKYSMIDREKAAPNLAYAADHQLAFLAYSPLAQGLLTGKITPERQFAQGDQRRSKDRFKPQNITKVIELLDAVRPIAEQRKLTVSQAVLAWTLAQRGCSHVLCGARSPQQAKENAAAGSVALSPEELASVSRAVEAFTGV